MVSFQIHAYHKLPHISNLSDHIKKNFRNFAKSFVKKILTCRHFKTRIEEHIKKDNKPHIFKHPHSTATCFDSCNPLCFKIIDKANSKFDLKIKEA